MKWGLILVVLLLAGLVVQDAMGCHGGGCGIFGRRAARRAARMAAREAYAAAAYGGCAGFAVVRGCAGEVRGCAGEARDCAGAEVIAPPPQVIILQQAPCVGICP